MVMGSSEHLADRAFGTGLRQGVARGTAAKAQPRRSKSSPAVLLPVPARTLVARHGRRVNRYRFNSVAGIRRRSRVEAGIPARPACRAGSRGSQPRRRPPCRARRDEVLQHGDPLTFPGPVPGWLGLDLIEQDARFLFPLFAADGHRPSLSVFYTSKTTRVRGRVPFNWSARAA